MQKLQYFNWFLLIMTSFNTIFCLNWSFYYFFWLYICVNYFHMLTFFSKTVFSLIKLLQKSMISDKGGREGKTISDFFWQGGRGGRPISDFGWHHMWTAPYTGDPSYKGALKIMPKKALRKGKLGCHKGKMCYQQAYLVFLVPTVFSRNNVVIQ